MKEEKKETVNYVAAIKEELEEHDLYFSSRVRGDDTIFTLPIPGENVPSILVRLAVDEDGDCKLRSFLANNVPEEKRSAMLTVLNGLNAQYRYICISMDPDGDICAAYDFAICTDSVFAQVIETVLLFAEIADKCIPEIMRLMWGREESSETDLHVGLGMQLFDDEEEEEI